MKIKIVGAVTVIAPKGYLAGGDSTNELERVLKRLASVGDQFLVINCAEVMHLDSVALGVLISAHKMYARRGGRMCFCCVDRRIENIFITTNLYLTFNLYPIEKLAIASFSSPERV